MRLICAALFFLIAHSASAEDILAQLGKGKWGIDTFPDMSCANNPHLITPDASRKKVTFLWDQPVANADGTQVTKVIYRVVKTKQDRVFLKRMDTGVVSVLKIAGKGNAYSWGSPDVSDAEFLLGFVRCNTN
jgi:hypothetical protein